MKNMAAIPYLTEKQQQVITMRLSGMHQKDIAEQLHCSRSNIAILERGAWTNLKRAYATINKWGELEQSAESMKKIAASQVKHSLADVMT